MPVVGLPSRTNGRNCSRVAQRRERGRSRRFSGGCYRLDRDCRHHRGSLGGARWNNAELCRRCDRCRPTGARSGAAGCREEGKALTQILQKQKRTDGLADEANNGERLVRLGYFVAIVLVLALVTGFSPFLG